MTERSEEQRQTYHMVEFFRKELREANKRGKSGLQLMISREDEGQFTLMDPTKDATEGLGMSGAEADQTFLRAFYDGLIDASFDSGGPHATTAIAFVTHLEDEPDAVEVTLTAAPLSILEAPPRTRGGNVGL